MEALNFKEYWLNVIDDVSHKYPLNMGRYLTPEEREDIKRLGIKHKWLEIVGRFAFPMNSPHLYENYLNKEAFFLTQDVKNFVKEGTNES